MKHITACFSHDLLKICERSYKDEKWEEIILNYLGAPLNQHIKLAQFSDGKLTLASESPIWAQELKMQLPQLRDHLRMAHHCYQLKFIQVKILPDLKLQPG
jgi:hypothetical protein